MRHIQLLILVFFLSFCSSPNKQDETPEEEEAELTYMKFYNMVIQETGQRIEWHGEDLEKSAAEFLTISEGDDPCGENDCGKAMFLENSGTELIHAVIQAPYQIDDVSSHLATQYSILGGSKISIGCSHFCYDGEAYLLERRVVGAKAGGEPF